jgi:hypothetical protein
MKRALLLLLVLTAVGCDARRFITGVDRPIEGKILSTLPTVDERRGAILLKDSGAIQLRVVGLTQFDFSMWTTLMQGEGFRILLRPVIEERIVDSGIVVSFSRTGTSVNKGALELNLRSVPLVPDTALQLRYHSENRYLYLMLGCDTVLQGMYPMKESDDIGIVAIPTSTVTLQIPNWEPTQNLKNKGEFDLLFSRTESDDTRRVGRLK